MCTFLLVITVFAATDTELGKKMAHTGALLPFAIGIAVVIGERYFALYIYICMVKNKSSEIHVPSTFPN